jgi:hypothetical protein
MKKNSFFIFIVLLSFFTLFSNYKVFHANVNQQRLVQIMAEGTYLIEDDYIDRISTKYPTLSSTVIPFNSVLGAYWIANNDNRLGFELLRKGNKENPFLGLSDLLLAQIYDQVGLKDSFDFYARAAISKLPNAPQHYVLISRLYVLDNKLDSLKILYDDIKDRIYDRQVFNIYLSAALNNRDQLDSLELVKDAKFAKEKFPFVDELNLVADYIIYGKERIDKIILQKQEAIDSFSVNPKKSINLMTQVITDLEYDVNNYEVLIEMYFRTNDYKNVVTLYNKLNELELTNLNATIIEFISISYLNLNENVIGCNLAQTLNSYGYRLSASLALACSIAQ